jgi:hypothetical protein
MIRFLILLLISTQAYATNFEDALKHKNGKKHWRRANSLYFGISHLDHSERLQETKKLLNRSCVSNECRSLYSHYYAYLYFKDVVKSKVEDLIGDLDLMSKEQKQVVLKCQGDMKCIETNIQEYCRIKNQTTMYIKPFCMALYVVNKHL